MLRAIRTVPKETSSAAFAIVASKYNGRYVDAMVKAALRELKKAGAKVEVIRVPGAFEIPAVVSALASGTRNTQHATRPSAIICFGVIFQGQTSHAEQIGTGVTHALAQIQVEQRIPVIHGVFVFEKEEYAVIRCLGKKHNRGTEAAHTALEMAQVMRSL